MQKLMHFLYMDQPIPQCFISVGTRGGGCELGWWVFFYIYSSKDNHNLGIQNPPFSNLFPKLLHFADILPES